MAGERQTEAHQAEMRGRTPCIDCGRTFLSGASPDFCKPIRDMATWRCGPCHGREMERRKNEFPALEAELARVRAERDEARFDASVAVTERDMAVASAVQQATARQAAEIVALLRSYANIHMTRALADLIEHKYVHQGARK